MTVLRAFIYFLVALIIHCAIMGLFYLAISFGSLEWNPLKWSDVARAAFAAIWLIALILEVGAIANDIDS